MCVVVFVPPNFDGDGELGLPLRLHHQLRHAAIFLRISRGANSRTEEPHRKATPEGIACFARIGSIFAFFVFLVDCKASKEGEFYLPL